MFGVRRRAIRTAVGLGLTILGFVVSAVLAIPALFVPLDVLTGFALVMVLSELAFAAVALAFLLVTRRGLAYLDLSVPTRRDVSYMVGGTVALLVVRSVGVAVIQWLGLPVGSSSTSQLAEQGLLEVFLILIPISILVVGPSEELLFRNVIQKYLSGAFSVAGSILVSSAFFALVHAPAILLATVAPLGVFTAVGLIFVISILLGIIYTRTGNVLVPIVVHGVYDAVLFAGIYFALVGGKVV